MNPVMYKGQTTTGPSRDLWADCPIGEMLVDLNAGVFGRDDFSQCPTWSAPAATLVDKYNVYGDTGVVIGPSGLQGGGLKISGNDADNDEGSIQVGGGGLLISGTAAVARKLWFEARIKKASIGDDGLAFFLGLMTPASAAADILVDNTGAMAASKSYIGFRNLQDNGEELDFVYADSGDAVVEWGANIATLAADTYVKLGFKYDPDATKRIRLWIDGVEYLTDALTAAEIAAASGDTFPIADVLAPMFATKVGTAAEVLTYMQWWQWAQLAL